MCVIAVSDAEWANLIKTFSDLIPAVQAIEFISHKQQPGEVCRLTAAEITTKLGGPWKSGRLRISDLTAVEALVEALVGMVTYDELKERATSGQLDFGKCLTPEEVLRDPQVRCSFIYQCVVNVGALGGSF